MIKLAMSEEEVLTAIRVHAVHLLENRGMPRPKNGTRLQVIGKIQPVDVMWESEHDAH